MWTSMFKSKWSNAHDYWLLKFSTIGKDYMPSIVPVGWMRCVRFSMQSSISWWTFCHNLSEVQHNVSTRSSCWIFAAVAVYVTYDWSIWIRKSSIWSLYVFIQIYSLRIWSLDRRQIIPFLSAPSQFPQHTAHDEIYMHSNIAGIAIGSRANMN